MYISFRIAIFSIQVICVSFDFINVTTSGRIEFVHENLF